MKKTDRVILLNFGDYWRVAFKLRSVDRIPRPINQLVKESMGAWNFPGSATRVGMRVAYWSSALRIIHSNKPRVMDMCRVHVDNDEKDNDSVLFGD